MFSYIQGKLAEITADAAVVDVNGVGYYLLATGSTLSRLPKIGAAVKLFTYMQVKEDGISLFGFLRAEELNMFKLLISVSGIGPKAAAGVLSALTPEQVVTAVISEDAVMLSKAPGIGKKSAARITLELQDKIRKKDAVLFEHGRASSSPNVADTEKQDAIDALMALGYSGAESLKAVLAVALENMPAAEIIKAALKQLK